MSAERPVEEMTGTVLEEKYRLVRVLGSGAMAHVYEAEQLRLGRSVAVKVMRGSLLGDKKSLERFRNEGLAASRINHPHAIAIYDVGVTQAGVPFLVMEHLRGKTLSALLVEQPLSPARIAAISAQILSALEEAHNCGVIHRDLKADNVVVETRRDGTDFVKVLDFGIAAFVDRPDQSIVGTPEYMSPEAIRGAQPAPSMDIYSMGILLYEMIVGRTPFAGVPTITSTLGKHLSEAPQPPHEIVPGCPRLLSDVVLRALEKDPARRIATAHEMREAVLAAAGDSSQACRQCGEPQPRGTRFCASCGFEHAERAEAEPELARASAALGLGTQPPASAPARMRPEKRPSRLSADLSAAVAATQPLTDESRTAAARHEPFVGRAGDLARLARFLDGSEGTTTLTIVGPRGVGKARLVLEAGRRLSSDAVMFIAGPDPSGQRLSWYPVLSMISAVLGLPARPSYEELCLGVARVGLPERDAPGLAELFGLEGPLAPMELAVRRRETYAATVRALAAVAHRIAKPVLAFVDVDRYDQPSRKLIEALAVTLAPPARMVLTASDGEQVPAGTALLPLSGLGDTEARAVLVRHAGRDRAALIAPGQLRTLTDGNPAAVLQVAGWLTMENDPAAMPARQVDLVAARLERLPAPARRVLQAIAAHGQVASRLALARLLSEIDPTGVALATLEREGLVVSSADELTIPLEIVAQVAESCTPADVRRELAKTVLAGASAEMPLAEIGHHAEAAGELDRALEAFVAAGDDAVRRFDDPRAASLYHAAVTVARAMQAAADPRAGTRLVAVSLRLADVLRHMGQLALAVGCLDEAELFGPTPAQHAGILRGRGRIAFMQDNPLRAVSLLRQAIGMAFRSADADFLCETYIDLALALSAMGNVAEAAAELAEAVDTITLGDGLARASGPTRLWVLGMHLAAMQLRARNLGAAKHAARDAIAQAEKAGAPNGLGRLHALLATILEAAGDTHTALVHQATALDHMRRLGDRRSAAEMLLACARMTGDLAPISADDARRAREPSKRSRDTARKAMEVAHELASEIGWQEGISLAAERADSYAGPR
jgi:tetratricopeptide (TPR) repeat protein/tRNA A-37 threonylcarbamoyl transferase component Bud32